MNATDLIQRLKRARETPDPYEDRVLAFVDVLGWKALVEQSVDKDADVRAAALSIVCESAEVMAAIRHWGSELNDISAALDETAKIDARVSHFSDHFVLSVPVGDAAEIPIGLMVAGICRRFLERGVYCRGAIVAGQLRHTEDVVYGPALLEAHAIEQAVAKYPRIVVAPTARPYFDSETFLYKDRDGLDVLDVLGKVKIEDREWLAGLRAIFEEKARGDQRRLDLLSKHGWFMAYLSEKERAAAGG
jgi:hypothetical protein